MGSDPNRRLNFFYIMVVDARSDFITTILTIGVCNHKT